MITVYVHNKNTEQAYKLLQRKMQREAVAKEEKIRRYHEKPSEKRIRKMAESARRRRKFEKKKLGQ